MIAAVAVGAMSTAAHHADPRGIDGRREHDTAAPVHTGMGGSAPALEILPLPEITRDTLAADVASLSKAQRLADQRDEAAAMVAMVSAERAATQHQAGRRGRLGPGGVVAPTTGVITSGFGARWGGTHYGLDIANDIGTPVASVMDGEVIESGPANGFGLWVRIRHDDGTVTVYGHLNETLVSRGRRVTAGEQIATVGNRGQSTGPHLHFEVHLGGERKTDPRAWLSRNGVPSDRSTL